VFLPARVRNSSGYRAALLVSALLFSGACTLCSAHLLRAGYQTGDDSGREFFEKKVRPVLAQNCYPCHSAQAKKLKGGLRLDSREGLLRGGDNGPAIVPGHAAQSRLIEAIGYGNADLRMPPKGKLPAQAIADLARWIESGAAWPRDASALASVPKGAKGSSASANQTFDLQKRKREHWAWQPIKPALPPSVKQRDWPRTAADAFILAKLEERKLSPAPPADRRTLLRRVYFDLIGLPPSPAAIEAFVRDPAPDALARVVDRLLASEHFGERWGRHWLDLVRYAETRGHEYDYPAPNAYQYRDYIIRAFNADVPYDQLVVEHVAGDLLPEPRLNPAQGFNESILGTGFWFLGEELHSPVDLRQDEADRFDNRIDVLTKTFLGLTVGCARCHDHKFDAISARDYYALFGFLESSSYRLARFDSLEHNRRIAEELEELRRRSRPLLERALADALAPAVRGVGDYLLAARQTLAQPSGEPPRGLDRARFERWVSYLRRAADDTRDPLQVWAGLATAHALRGPESVRLVSQRAAKGRLDRRAAWPGTQVIIDYGRASARDWLADGVAFGLGPALPGEPRLSGDPTRPLVRLVDRGAAEKDAFWDGLQVAPGTETDPGALGGLVRAGRTIRTPSFALTTGRLYYLVRGTGQAYAAVDEHALIAGPLHGQLVQGLQAGDDFRWIVHDLSSYRGQRAHVEFTARPDRDFAVAMVVQASQLPTETVEPNGPVVQMLADQQTTTPAGLAAGYEALFQKAVDGFRCDRIVGAPEARGYAEIINWLLSHSELFPLEESATRRFRTAAQALQDQETQIRRRVQIESRLALAMLDGNGVDEQVFVRGSPKAPGRPAPRRFLEALAGDGPLPIRQGSGRLELARQMTDPALDPFIARVVVNRVWYHLFGRGLVASVDNFGALGELPTHPELLDYLSTEFVRQGWSIKRLIRSLVLSSTYAMSSRADASADAIDPQDLLLHRMRVRRLEGEAIRDALLAVSGRLDERAYGPPVPVHLTEFQDGRGRPANGPLDGDGRRSIYLAVRRNFLPSFLLAFDTPIPFSTVGRRTVSNVPAQALILMNDPFVHQQAGGWGRRVATEPGSPGKRIEGMYLSAFGRPPTPEETSACLDFLGRQARFTGDRAAWTDLAHALFNVKEFIYLH
jgi:Protein of unknown function (DUF1553)/Protein of unknown function (DUF1549)/Planctomycete cytochrome C